MNLTGGIAYSETSTTGTNHDGVVSMIDDSVLSNQIAALFQE